MPRELIVQTTRADAATRLDWLDGVRGCAILGVVLVHAGQMAAVDAWPNRVFSFGQYGVQLFFVISALTCILTLQKGVPVLDWYIRRATRIAVVYYFGLLFYLPIFNIEAALGIKGRSFSNAWDILANVFFIHGWVPSANNNVVPGGWSIAVEMTFYAIAPVAVALLRKPAQAALVLAGLGLGLLMLNEALAGPVLNNSFTYFWPVNQLPVFLLVIAAYGLSCQAGRDIWTAEKPLPLVTAAGAVCVILGGWIGIYSGFSHVVAPSLIGLGCFIVLAGWGRWRRIAEVRWLISLGQISFSLYIIHFAFVDLAQFVVKRLLPEPYRESAVTWLLATALIFILSVWAAKLLRHHIEEKYRPLSNWLTRSMRNVLMKVASRYFHPTEVKTLPGDSAKAKEKLCCVPQIEQQEMFKVTAATDIADAQHPMLKAHGYHVPVSTEH